MAFRIRGLEPAPFRPLFDLPDIELAARRIVRRVVTDVQATPCRVSLDDAGIGEEVLLMHHVHQPAETPYHASHAIYVRRAADAACIADDDVPPALRRRLLSVRAFDASHMMVDADVVQGEDLAARVVRLFERSRVAYLHVHYAKAGCFAARIERWEAGAAAVA